MVLCPKTKRGRFSPEESAVPIDRDSRGASRVARTAPDIVPVSGRGPVSAAIGYRDTKINRPSEAARTVCGARSEGDTRLGTARVPPCPIPSTVGSASPLSIRQDVHDRARLDSGRISITQKRGLPAPSNRRGTGACVRARLRSPCGSSYAADGLPSCPPRLLGLRSHCTAPPGAARWRCASDARRSGKPGHRSHVARFRARGAGSGRRGVPRLKEASTMTPRVGVAT